MKLFKGEGHPYPVPVVVGLSHELPHGLHTSRAGIFFTAMLSVSAGGGASRSGHGGGSCPADGADSGTASAIPEQPIMAAAMRIREHPDGIFMVG